MRSKAAVGAFVSLALLAAACDPLERQYFREGIGTSLDREDIARASELQATYLSYLCYQAGVTLQSAEGRLVCDTSSKAWELIVQAGMNDIDLRCDSYLAWLDNKKRSQEPILKELAAVGAATTAILSATKVGPTPMALVGIAFGLAAETFTNINSRLVQEVDHSTVQTTVLANQQKFRKQLIDQRPVIDSQPTAVYLLRSYLRICMPFSIEMDINNTVTVYHRDGASALSNDSLLVRAPSVFRTTYTPLNNTTRRIRNFAYANADNQRRVKVWLDTYMSGIAIETFVRSKEFASQHQKIIRDLIIP